MLMTRPAPLLVLLLPACTIVPAPVISHHISISETGKPDSGIVSASLTGYPIEPSALARYNDLIATYGRDPHWHPPLVPDQGVTRDATGIRLDREAMRRFLLLSEWARMGRLPPKKPGWLGRLL